MEIQNNLNIKILMYHRIVGNDSSYSPGFHDVNVDKFRQQLQLLESLNYTPITFEDYHLYQKGELTLPRKPIIITFDDGHYDMFETALPILREFNMKAVIFVLGDRSLKYSNWDEDSEAERCPLMSAEQILALRKEGFEIGAHTMSHPNLAELPEAKIKQEIIQSKKEIEELLGEEILSFAYPYGGVNETAESVVKNAGFKYGCGVYTGPPKFGENLFDIRRLAINYNINTPKYLLRILCPYEYAEWMYGKLRNRNPRGLKSAAEKAPIRDYDFTTTNNF